MNLEAFLNNFAILSSAPNGIALLRRLILQLAFRGKLLPQDPGDEPASVLLEEIQKTKAKSDNDKKAKIRVHLRAIEDDGKPFTLPSCWRWSRFVDIATIASNLVQPWDYLDYPHVAPDNIEKFTGRLLPCRTVREDKVSSSNHKFFEGQIVYSKIRPNLAKAVIVDFEGLCSADMYPINSHIYPPFLLYYLLSDTFLNMAVKSDTRVAMPKINQEELNRILVPVPSLAEQKRIVAKVKKLMRLCDELEARQQAKRESRVGLNAAVLAPLNKAASLTPEEFEQSTIHLADNFDTLYDSIDTVSKLRSTTLQLAIQGKLVPQDPNEPDAHILLAEIEQEKDRQIKQKKSKQIESLPRITQDDFLNMPLPIGWAWAWLGDLARFVDYRGKTPTKTENGVKLLTAKNVKMGFISEYPLEFVSEDTYVEVMTRGLPRFGDILFTTEAPLGNVAQLLTHEPVTLAQRVIDLQPFNPLFAEYLKLCLMSPLLQQAVMERATGMTATGIRASKLKRLPVPVPPLAEQKRIVAKVNRLMSLCDELEAKLWQSEADSEKLMNAAIKYVLDSVRANSKEAEEVFA